VLRQRLRVLLDEDRGQDLVEYALLLALFGLACLTTWDLIAGSVGARYSSTNTGVQGLWDTPPPSGSSP
jgi:Flp pilus assembly pilin Flp